MTERNEIALTLTKDEISKRLHVAISLARDAGDFVYEERQRKGVAGIGVAEKGHQDFVTEMDRTSEDMIRQGLQSHFPTDGFLGEESDGQIVDRATWVVDPIDGTMNYIRGTSHWAISIALVSNNTVVAGIVYNPSTKTTYTATLQGGAHRNGERIQRLAMADPARGLAVVGYNHKMDIEEHCKLLRALHGQGFDYRNAGCASMDLIDLAEGRVDATFVHQLNSWDVLAGLLVATEAGADAFHPALPEFFMDSGPVYCAAKEISTGFSQLLNDASLSSVPQAPET